MSRIHSSYLSTPEVKLINSYEEPTDNIVAMANATRVCYGLPLFTEKAIAIDFFIHKWFPKYILEQKNPYQRHLSVLQHAFLHTEGQLTQFTLREYSRHLRFIQDESLASIMYTFFPLSNPCYQFEFITNRCTAMQLVRHTTKYSNINFLVESSRVNYLKEGAFKINSFLYDKLLKGTASKEEEYALTEIVEDGFKTYDIFHNRLKNKYSDKNDLRRATQHLSQYRQIRMIGSATLYNWIEMCKKRVNKEVQDECRYIIGKKLFPILMKLKGEN